jgi:hypothetical protein
MTATFPFYTDLPEALASSGGDLCVGCEVGRAGRREGVERGPNEGKREFQRGVAAYNWRGALGLWWASPEAIGQRGRCLGAALWAASR